MTVPPPVPRLPLHRGWIIACAILFWPLAVAAVLAANQAARAIGAGDTATAAREAQTARNRARTGVLVGSIWTVLVLAVNAPLAVLGMHYAPGLLDQAGLRTAPEQPVAESYRTAAAPEREPISVDPLDLRTGDCFMAPDWDSPWAGIDVIPCSRLHDGQVIGVIEHHQIDFPGSAALEDDFWYDCWSWYETYSGREAVDSSPVWSFQPTREDWAAGDRTSVCFIEALYPVEGEFSAHPQVFELKVNS
ncbi:hypothetical protein GCM10010413_03460 [Promicromonospora sukumoe]|uniref:Regulator of septum formation n=1 Tax=Promicromonospora sukumoe TaxID=88382 RepID=A0A7W3JEX5_9MICO|nr:septum formation family protein [Promicromonospora sukumoe]MBA8811597.1 hypothetical protein [Promicromonospora sukumoe]